MTTRQGDNSIEGVDVEAAGRESIDGFESFIATTVSTKDPQDASASIPRLNDNQRGENDDDSSSSMTSNTYEYVDFVPLPPPPIPPPAKYKLWILILTLVYLAVWFAEEAHVVQALTFNGWLSNQAAVFLLMNITVLVSTYAALDVLVFCLSFRYNNRTYGLEAWLKRGRIHLIDKKNNKDNKYNFVVEFLDTVITIMEEGFEIFNPTDTLKKDDIPEASKRGRNGQETTRTDLRDGIILEDDKDSCHVTLKVVHRIKPEYKRKYEAWQDKIARRAKIQPGFIQATRLPSTLVVDRPLENTGTTSDIKDNNGILNESRKSTIHCQDEIFITFDGLCTLNDWMTSPERQVLTKELEPMLAGQDIVQLVKNRALPDAFTDLLVRQGESVPVRPPKKWKVYWLTSCGLFFTSLIFERILPHYYDKWGISSPNTHKRLVAFVDVLFSTWFVSYLMQPLLIMQFSEWLRRKSYENETNEPWRTLNDGFESLWAKFALTLAYFGGTGIKWAVTAYTR